MLNIGKAAGVSFRGNNADMCSIKGFQNKDMEQILYLSITLRWGQQETAYSRGLESLLLFLAHSVFYLGKRNAFIEEILETRCRSLPVTH